jgi:hypothetical protein
MDTVVGVPDCRVASMCRGFSRASELFKSIENCSFTSSSGTVLPFGLTSIRTRFVVPERETFKSLATPPMTRCGSSSRTMIPAPPGPVGPQLKQQTRTAMNITQAVALVIVPFLLLIFKWVQTRSGVSDNTVPIGERQNCRPKFKARIASHLFAYDTRDDSSVCVAPPSLSWFQ